MSHQQPPSQFPQQPGPVEEPKPKRKFGRKILIGIGAVVALFIAIGVFSDGDDETVAPATDTAVEPESEAEPAEQEEPEAEPAEEQPITVEAVATDFRPSVLHDGGEFTSVEVTVVNNSEENVEVNPLFFALVADDGSKVNAVLGEDERQIDTLTLSPGQQATGVLTGEGSFTVASVEFAPDLFGGDTFVGQVQ